MKRARLTPRKESLGLGAALALLTGSLASAQQPLVAVNISARPAASALTELAHQTGVNVLFSPQVVHGVQSTPVEAVLSPEAAARALLAGTRLEVVKDATGTLIVREPTGTGVRTHSEQASATAEQTATDPVHLRLRSRREIPRRQRQHNLKARVHLMIPRRRRMRPSALRK